MTILEMLEQSGALALLGMGIVFSFLVMLILCISATGKFFQAREAAGKVNLPEAGVPPVQPVITGNTAAVAAAITAAVHEYRKNNS